MSSTALPKTFAYSGVPLAIIDDADVVKPKPNASREVNIFSTVAKISAIAVSAIAGLLLGRMFFFCGLTLNGKERPTLLSGGGRDWLIDVQNQMITAKHYPHLALGSFDIDPLILTHRYSALPEESDLLQFSRETLEVLKNGKSVSVQDLNLELQFPTPMSYDEWDVLFAGIQNVEPSKSNFSNVDDNFISYVDENFLIFNGIYALDVSYWKIEEGNTVNFVKASDRPNNDAKTLAYGGGRDWVVNDDGTISPKGYPRLALGRGKRSLMLADKDQHPGNVWKFPTEQLVKLQEGKVMELRESLVGIKEKYQQERNYDGWRYIETQVIDTNDGIQVQYVEDNYLALVGRTEEKALVLDVAFWKMEDLSSINFVGGSSYTD